VKQRKRNAQDRKDEQIEDGAQEVNNEVNRSRKEIEKLRRRGKSKEMRNVRN
jgi:hypothetical protein